MDDYNTPDTMNNMTTTVPDFIQVTTEYNPWAGQFGTLQVIEVIYLTVLCVLGTIGNLVVICSISLEKRVHAHGNIFIINLAFADLLVTGLVVPTIIANVIKTSNALNHPLCIIVGYLVTTTCTCSLCNLMFIAINRYWAIVRNSTYSRVFARKRIYWMVAFTWFWSLLAVMPTQLGWGGLRYDVKIMVCEWDDTIDYSYTITLTLLAIFTPMCVIAACYYKLFTTVRSSGRWVRSLSVGSGVLQQNDQHRRSMRKEQSLLRTLATTVIVFCICWLPFGFTVVIDPTNTPAHAKKFFGWMGVTNSCVNFIIYGAMNPVFRRGYHNLFVYLFRCKRARKISSTVMHGSFSDSMRGTRKGRSTEKKPTAVNSKVESQKEFSRVETQGLQTQITLANNSPAINRIPAITTSDADVEKSATTHSPSTNGISTLKIALSDDDESGLDFSDDDLAFTRRTQSEIPKGVNKPATIRSRHQTNGNCNSLQQRTSPHEISRKIESMKDEIGVIQAPLRGSWLPPGAVYKSRDNSPLPGSSPVKRTNASPDNKPKSELEQKVDHIITTVSGVLHAKNYNISHPIDDTGKNDESNNGVIPISIYSLPNSPANSPVSSRSRRSSISSKNARDSLEPTSEQEKPLLTQPDSAISVESNATRRLSQEQNLLTGLINGNVVQ